MEGGTQRDREEETDTCCTASEAFSHRREPGRNLVLEHWDVCTLPVFLFIKGLHAQGK